MSDTQKKPTGQRPASQARKTPVPEHKKIYGAETDIIDSVVRSVKRDSAQRNNPGGRGVDEPIPTGNGKRTATQNAQRRANSTKSFEPTMMTRLRERWDTFMAATRNLRIISAVMIALVLVITALFLDAQTIDVMEETLTVYGLHEDLQGVRILHLSDMNSTDYGDQQAQLIRKLDSLDYDIVVLTGDMVGGRDDATQLYELLDALPSSKPVYFIAGDADEGPFVEVARDLTGTLNQMVLEEWVIGAQDRGAVFVDRPTALEIGDAKIWFTPADMLATNLTETRALYRDLEAQQKEGLLAGITVDYEAYPFTAYEMQRYDESYKSAASMTTKDLHISLSHVPPSDEYIRAVERGVFTENIEDVQVTRPDMILAGHYCNGVWHLPLLGALYADNADLPLNGWLPNESKISGMRTVSDTPMYISGGLSTNSETPAMFTRLLNHSQVSIITLTGEMPSSLLGD